MCLLLTGKSSTVRATFMDTPGLTHNAYGYNSDGLGIMYVQDGAVKVIKGLPQSAGEAHDLMAQLPDDDREVAVHWRMRTHGATDLEQCHPYAVNGKSWLMHNGILHTGNKADPAKSDTWHFVRDFLATMGDNALHDAGALRMIAKFIDNNRFAIMSPDGRLSVVNRDQGIEHAGVWYSNTYAWDAGILIPSERRVYKFSNYTRGKSAIPSFGSRYDKDSSSHAYDDYINGTEGFYTGGRWDDEWQARLDAREEEGAPDTTSYDDLIDAIEEGLYEMEPALFQACLEQDAGTTTAYLFENYTITQHAHYKKKDNPVHHHRALQCWLKKDAAGMAQCYAHDLAEALCYSADVEWRQSPLMQDKDTEEAQYAEAVREVRALPA